MNRSVILISMLMACTSSSKDDSGSDTGAAAGSGTTTPDYSFENVSNIGPLNEALFERAAEDSDPERGSYFPARRHFWPTAFVAVEAPEPPYEIRSLSMYVLAAANANCNEFDDNWDCQEPADCDTTVPIRLVAYVGDQTPRSFPGSDEELAIPDVPVIASVDVSGGFGAPGVGDAELLVGVLESPVVVEETGTLWIGYQQITESGLQNSCPAGYTSNPSERSDADGNAFVWWEQVNLFSAGGTGWNATEPEIEQLRLVIQAEVAH